MDLSKISRNDWIVVGGFVLMLIGVSLTWYGWSVAGISVPGSGASGWHFFLGWFPWLLTLVALAVVAVKAIPSLKIAFPVPEPLIVLALGVIAFVLVLIRLVVAPGYAYAELLGRTIHANRGAGLFVSLIATAVVAVGGFLKNAEPAS